MQEHNGANWTTPEEERPARWKAFDRDVRERGERYMNVVAVHREVRSVETSSRAECARAALNERDTLPATNRLDLVVHEGRHKVESPVVSGEG